MPSESNDEVIYRLRSAAGHLHSVIKMVEADRPRDEILHQLNAVRAALRTTGYVICKVQIDHSLNIIRCSQCMEERKSEIIRMVNIYQQIAKN